VQGESNHEKAKGRVEVRAVNEGVRLADISADLSAESTNGSILLDRIDSANVDLYTVNGNISYDGPIKDKGLYRLTTHNGLIAMPVPERANAIVTLRTYNGGIRSTFQLPGDTGERRKRQTLTLGNGSAHVELESFSGTISLRRPGEPRPETERKRRDRDKDNKDNKDNGLAMADVQIEIDRALADLQPEIDRALAEAQPEIDRAIAEAMREIGPQVDVAIDMANEALWSIPGVPFVMPHVASPFPLPRPTPRPR